MKKSFLTAFALLMSPLFAAPKVVTTIKPLHSLTSLIMAEVAEPILLIEQGSPHGYALKPSDTRHLSDADLFVWVSDDLETFAPSIANKIGNKLNTLTWANIEGITLLENRKGGLWQDSDADDDDEHEHGHHHHHHVHGHHDHDHDHGIHNPHLWLGTAQAQSYLAALTERLSQLDPVNASRYQANYEQASAELTQLHNTLNAQLDAVAGKDYIVFHDAYHYFEDEFKQLNPVGVIRVDPEHEAGARRIAQIHQRLQKDEVRCLFKEPQFSPKLVDRLIQGTTVKSATLDPLGSDLSAGKTLYAKLLTNLADNLTNCLKD